MKMSRSVSERYSLQTNTKYCGHKGGSDNTIDLYIDYKKNLNNIIESKNKEKEERIRQEKIEKELIKQFEKEMKKTLKKELDDIFKGW
jgi:hypothetical protein